MKQKEISRCCFVVFFVVASAWSQTPGSQVRTPTTATSGGWANTARIEVIDSSGASFTGFPGDSSGSLIG